jgi:hypothetical protein
MIFIHIGVSKAGSSTIQTFMDTHEGALRELSVNYPSLGRLNRRAHHNFANELKGRADKFNPASGRISEFVAQLRERRHRTTVLSSEGFWTCSAEAVKRFAASLAGVDEPIRIILVIRDMVDLAPSMYAQDVRHGIRTFDFDSFFEQRQASDRFNAFEAARRWADAFGWEAIVVRVLDPAMLVGGDLISDFLTQVGLDPASERLSGLPRQPRVNASAGWMTLEAVRALFGGDSGLSGDHPLMRHITAGMPDFRKKRIGMAGEAVGGTIGWNRDRGRYLTLDQAARLHEAHLEMLASFNAHLPYRLPPPADLDARGFVARPFMPDASHIPPVALENFYDAVAVHVETEARRNASAKKAAKAARR